MGSKLVIGAFILMVVAVLIAAMFFFDPTVFYPKLSPSPR
jgi:predicted membrane protein